MNRLEFKIVQFTERSTGTDPDRSYLNSKGLDWEIRYELTLSSRVEKPIGRFQKIDTLHIPRIEFYKGRKAFAGLSEWVEIPLNESKLYEDTGVEVEVIQKDLFTNLYTIVTRMKQRSDDSPYEVYLLGNIWGILPIKCTTLNIPVPFNHVTGGYTVPMIGLSGDVVATVTSYGPEWTPEYDRQPFPQIVISIPCVIHHAPRYHLVWETIDGCCKIQKIVIF